MTRWLEKGGALLTEIEMVRVAAVEAAAPESSVGLRHASDEIRFLEETAERRAGVEFRALHSAGHTNVKDLEQGGTGVLLFVEFEDAADNALADPALGGDGVQAGASDPKAKKRLRRLAIETQIRIGKAKWEARIANDQIALAKTQLQSRALLWAEYLMHRRLDGDSGRAAEYRQRISRLKTE